MKLYRATCISILIFFAIGSLFVATEYVAYKLGFNACLGVPVARFIIPFYNPLAIIGWTIKYYHKYAAVFDVALYICASGLLSGLLIMGLVSIILLRHSKVTDTHGTARWACTKEVKAMGFNQKKGVILGKFPGVGVLAHNGPEHILLNAPTRSGKGVGFIIPTLFAWLSSVVVLDIKKENWSITSGFRKKFSHVLCFDPTSLDGACWNPLLEVRKGINEVKDVQNIADILVDPNGSGKRDHWAQTGHALLVATILHVLYAEPDKTLSGVANFLANPARDIIKTLHYMKSTIHLGDKTHPVVASAAQEMLNKSENELSGVLSTAMSFLGLYRDPIVARNTSKSDFKINDLMNAAYPVSLYLVVPAGDLDRLISLNRLIINMICRRLTEVAIGAKGSPHKHKLLLLLDEFPALGCMDFFKKSLGFMAGYNIKCMLVCQSYSNIYEHYGLKNSIFDNCHIRATMAPNDLDTARCISSSLGQTTVKRHQINFTGKRLAPFLANISVADQETGRNLLNPDEVQKLPEDQVIIMVAKNYPIIANKILYYQEEPFKSRCLAAPDLNQDEYIDLPKKSSNDAWYDVGRIEHHKDVQVLLPAINVELENFTQQTAAIKDQDEGEADCDMQTCSNRITRHVALGVDL
jgi:type IV secretion system protein VirD4